MYVRKNTKKLKEQVNRVGPKPGPGRGLVLGALRGLARAGSSQSVQLHPGTRSDRVLFTEGPTFRRRSGARFSVVS